MDDSRLLELASSAAGEAFDLIDRNPLERDDLALRLAVKLGLFTGPDFYRFRSLERFAGQDTDEYTATRRAIVRAAAALGEPHHEG